MLGKFVQKLLLLYEFSQDTDAKSIYTRKIRGELTEFLAKLAFSPVLYMIGADNMDPFLKLMDKDTNPDYKSSLMNRILDYTNEVIDLQAFINQNIRDGAPLAKFFFTKIKPFSMQELCSKNQMKYPYQGSYMVDIKHTFTLQSKLFPIIYLDAANLQYWTYKPIRVDNITLIMSTILHNLSTIVDFTLLNLDYKFKQGHEQATECELKLQITPFQYDFISSYYKVPEVQEYVYKKNRMIINHFIQNNSVTSNEEEEEESFIQKLCAMTAWQEFVEKVTREQMLDLFESGKDFQEFFKASRDFVLLFSKIILGHISNSEMATFDVATPCVSKSSRWINSEKNLKWYAQQGQKAIKRHFELISRLLNSKIDPGLSIKERRLLKHKQVILLKEVRSILPQLLDIFDKKLMLLAVVNDSRYEAPSLFETMRAIYVCFDGILNRLVHINSNKNAETELCKDFDNKMTLETGYRNHCTEYSYEKDVYKQFLSKAVIFYERGFCHPIIDKAYRGVVCEFLENITQSLDAEKNDLIRYKESSFNCSQLYSNPRLNGLQTLSSVLSFLISFRSTDIQASCNEKQFYASILWRILRLVEDYGRDLNFKENCFNKGLFVKNTFVPSYRDLIVSLMIIAEEMLISWLRSDTQKENFCKVFDVLYEVLRSWMDIGKVYNKSLYNMLSAKKSNMLILFYFSLMNADNFKRLAADEEMLSMTTKLYGKQFYVIAEIYALQAFEPENILEMKLKSLVHLDNSGRRILENASIEGLDRYYSSILEQIWKSKFVVRKTTMPSSIIISRESAGKYLYTLRSN